jgi:hypothetical protein
MNTHHLLLKHTQSTYHAPQEMEPLKVIEMSTYGKAAESIVWPRDKGVRCWFSHSRVPWGEVHRGFGRNKYTAYIHYGYDMLW